VALIVLVALPVTTGMPKSTFHSQSPAWHTSRPQKSSPVPHRPSRLQQLPHLPAHCRLPCWEPHLPSVL
jgi:hypothetical protein